MRIALILASNLYMSPYVRYYTELLDRYGIAYDIIAWNRFGIEEVGVQAFNLKSSLHKSVIGKMVDYIRYRQYVKKKLTDGNYKKVVVFTVVNALILFPLLNARYNNNYILDIRDHVAAVKYYPKRFVAAIQHAAMVVISSTGYKCWLPQNEYYVIRHNTAVVNPVDSLATIKEQSTYKILTIGAIGYYEANCALIESLANDPMFDLEFVGSGYAEKMLKKYVASQNITNVRFQGRYNKEDEPKYLQGISLLSIMIDDSVNSRTCMSNRFYLSMIYGIPMIVDSGTEQAEWVKRYNLGVIIDKKTNLKGQILQYLKTFNKEIYEAGRNASLRVIQRDVAEFEAKTMQFFEINV